MDWMHIVQNTVACSIVHHHDSFDNDSNISTNDSSRTWKHVYHL